jgi:protein-S-isoprenylcysteine O-methyltransferase Ste14
MSQAPWWRGERGEWYVVLQFALFALVASGPRTWSGWPALAFPDSSAASAAGVVLMSAGFFLMLAGILKIGANITPLPHPVENAVLLTGGPYRIVRHPMYAGAVFMAFGWAAASRGWLTFGYAAILFAFFDLKTRREERWLCEKFPGYAAYRKRVCKLIPFVY